jgi:5'-3' exonuclease
MKKNKTLLIIALLFLGLMVYLTWDMGSKTFRTEMYDDYKANRPAPPQELIPQFELVKEVVDAFDIPNVGIVGYEADDCIGTLARQLSNDADVLILTGDQDILQLIDENISVIILKKGYGNYAVYQEDTFVREKFVEPGQRQGGAVDASLPDDSFHAAGAGHQLHFEFLAVRLKKMRDRDSLWAFDR